MLVGVAGEVWLSAWLKYICLMRTLKASNEVHTEIYFVLWPFLLSMIDHHLYIFSLIVRSPGLLERVAMKRAAEEKNLFISPCMS